jgi:hypothetical protein
MPELSAKSLVDIRFCRSRREAVDFANMFLQCQIAEFHVNGIDWLIFNPTMAINLNEVSVLFWAKLGDSSDFVFDVFRRE